MTFCLPEVVLTVDFELVQFDEESPLLGELPGLVPFIELGCYEDPAHSRLGGAAVVSHGDVVHEFLVLQMGDSYEDIALALEVHAACYVDVRFLPESVEGVGTGIVRDHFDVGYLYARIVELKWKI